MLASLFKRRSASSPAIPAGRRVYAIGDVHGRSDCLDALIAMIDADDAGREAADTTIVMLGDLIDRGPDSAGVVERCRALAAARSDFVLITGNHEEILLRAAQGERPMLSLFDKVGGRDTLISYGVSPKTYDDASLDDLADLIGRHVPQDHRLFLAGGVDQLRIGDYVFVHAGIRPGIPLDRQETADLRWIRDPFLRARQRHEAMVVHGHTITAAVDIRPNRIGIDTGAYASNTLTAIGLERADRWFLAT